MLKKTCTKSQVYLRCTACVLLCCWAGVGVAVGVPREAIPSSTITRIVPMQGKLWLGCAVSRTLRSFPSWGGGGRGG